MRRAALIWIALATVVLASPLTAQQTTPDDMASPKQPLPQTSTELPPPFPHYPARAPREHDPNYHAPIRSHQHGESHRSGRTHHHGKAHRRGRTHRHVTHEHFSKRTIRQCHSMNYRQIMRHRDCRVLIKQELEAAEHRDHHAKRSSSAHRHGPLSHRRPHHKRG